MIKRNTRVGLYDLFHIVFLVISCLLFTRCFNLLGWDLIFGIRNYIIIGGVVTLLVFFKALKSMSLKAAYCRYIAFLFLWPLVEILLSFISENSLYDELVNGFSWTFIIGIYWILKKYHVKESSIIISLTIFAIMTSVIQIFEQIHPEFAIFGVIDPTAENYMGEIADIRNNLYRLRVGSLFIQSFCFFYYWDQIISKKKYIYIILELLFLTSIYLYLTRQVIIAVISTCVFSMLLQKSGASKRILLSLLIALGFVVFINFEVLFGSLVSDYTDNTYTTDIRWECMSNTLIWQFSNISSLFLGAGYPKRLLQSWYDIGYDMSDIGFFGAGFHYGILWTFAYFFFILKVLKTYKHILPNYIILYIISTAIMSLFIFPYTNAPGFFVWTCMLYILSIHVEDENKKRLDCFI